MDKEKFIQARPFLPIFLTSPDANIMHVEAEHENERMTGKEGDKIGRAHV